MDVKLLKSFAHYNTFFGSTYEIVLAENTMRDAEELLENVSKPPCPFCSKEIHIEKVNREDSVRTYFDDQMMEDSPQPISRQNNLHCVTPPRSDRVPIEQLRMFKTPDRQLRDQIGEIVHNYEYQDNTTHVIDIEDISIMPRKIWSAPTAAKRSKCHILTERHKEVDSHNQYTHRHSFVAYKNIITPLGGNLPASTAYRISGDMPAQSQNWNECSDDGMLMADQVLGPIKVNQATSIRPFSAPGSLFSMFRRFRRAQRVMFSFGSLECEHTPKNAQTPDSSVLSDSSDSSLESLDIQQFRAQRRRVSTCDIESDITVTSRTSQDAGTRSLPTPERNSSRASGQPRRARKKSSTIQRLSQSLMSCLCIHVT